jgi:hypothetical protein
MNMHVDVDIIVFDTSTYVLKQVYLKIKIAWVFL